jgi:hypothetical protein
MLVDNARQLDLPNWPLQRRGSSLRSDHYVVGAHDANPRNPKLRPTPFCKVLQISAHLCTFLPISSEAD